VTTQEEEAHGQDLWCRLETAGDRVLRVLVMHPNGEILASWPPERFEATLLGRMRAGRIRAQLASGDSEGFRVLSLRDDSGEIVHSETIPE